MRPQHFLLFFRHPGGHLWLHFARLELQFQCDIILKQNVCCLEICLCIFILRWHCVPLQGICYWFSINPKEQGFYPHFIGNIWEISSEKLGNFLVFSQEDHTQCAGIETQVCLVAMLCLSHYPSCVLCWICLSLSLSLSLSHTHTHTHTHTFLGQCLAM
jgi:hypothetical protein